MTAIELESTIKTADKPALELLVDAFFAGLKARVTNVLGKNLLRAANTVLDVLIEKYLT